jgi:signal transduction histidine kinase
MSDHPRPTTEPQNTDRAGATPAARDRLLANTERILTLWEQRVREEVAAARREPHPILIDTLPAMLQQLAEALSRDHPRRTATDGSTVAHEHGGERVRLTRFGLEDLVTEYKILRGVLSDVLEGTGGLSPEERNTLNASLDGMIIEACTAYVVVQSTFRDRLFATIAHDLRNPLNAAQAAAALIVRRPQAKEVADWARRIVENIGRVDRMVQDVLNAMRVQAGARLQLEIKACDLVEVVRQTLDRTQLEGAGRFVLAAPEPVRGYFAPDVLQRAVENLVDNAVKYGAPSRPITIGVHENHGRAILTVHNQGTHIPAEKQETLFRAFQRLTDAGTSGKRGWGLGLAQVRAVAEAHGGSIGVDSLPERGTTFIIDIPLDARPYQDNPTTAGPELDSD